MAGLSDNAAAITGDACGIGEVSIRLFVERPIPLPRSADKSNWWHDVRAWR
jgi:hypothetical protein